MMLIALQPALPTTTTILPTFQLPIPSKPELPLSLLLSTPNRDPNRFKTCTSFKPTFQIPIKIPIASKLALPTLKPLNSLLCFQLAN
jgi:hypothetical protein